MNWIMRCILASIATALPSSTGMPGNAKSTRAAFCSSQAAISVLTKSNPKPMKVQSLAKTLRAHEVFHPSGKPATLSTVLNAKIIRSICARKPDTLEKLQAITGMGAVRIVKYGMDILKLVCAHKNSLKRQAKRKFLESNVKKKICKPKKTPRRPRPRPRPKPTQPRPYGPRCELLDSPVLFRAPCVAPLSAEAGNGPQPSVYILELEQGRVYVGTSRDVERRVAQHLAGEGAAFTRAFRPTGLRLPRLGNVSGCGDATERDETLRYMYLRGKDFVRGWKYTQVTLQDKDYEEAESNIRELYDLCRRCGCKGHFMSQCRRVEDRFGNLIA